MNNPLQAITLHRQLIAEEGLSEDGDAQLAIGMILGFLTPLTLIVAIFPNLNYISLAGVRPKDITVNNCYPCEQGQTYTMLVTEITLLATLSWTVWSIDSLLGLF